MRLPFPSRGRKHTLSVQRLKSLSSQASTSLPDLLSTSLHALKESAEAFPPLSSAVGGVLAVWEIAEVGTVGTARIRHTNELKMWTACEAFQVRRTRYRSPDERHPRCYRRRHS